MEVLIKNDCPLRYTTIIDNNCTPHWKTAGNDGRMSMLITTHDDAKWVSIDTNEYAEKSIKRTMVTLDENAGRALYNQLHKLYGE